MTRMRLSTSGTSNAIGRHGRKAAQSKPARFGSWRALASKSIKLVQFSIYLGRVTSNPEVILWISTGKRACGKRQVKGTGRVVGDPEITVKPDRVLQKEN